MADPNPPRVKGKLPSVRSVIIISTLHCQNNGFAAWEVDKTNDSESELWARTRGNVGVTGGVDYRSASRHPPE